MKDINSGGGTETDIENEMQATMLMLKMLHQREAVWQNALRHSLLAAVYAL